MRPERAGEDGAKRCAEVLSRLSRSDWKLAVGVTGAPCEAGLEAMLEQIHEDHFGSYLTVSGASFLVFFDRRSAFKVCERFSGERNELVRALVPKPEATVLAEVANVVVNALLESLSEASGEVLILSAPKTRTETPRELLRGALARLRDPRSVAAAQCLTFESDELGARCELVALLEADLAAKLGWA